MRILTFILAILVSGCAGVHARYHRVQAGEDLQSIAERYEVPVKELQASNGGTTTVRTGQKVFIPYEVAGDWSRPRSVSREVASAAVYDAEPVRVQKLEDASPLIRYVWPVSGRLSSKFGRRHGKFHEGIDIAAPEGMNVRAARSGHVIYSSNRIAGYGNLVIVRHADGYSTVYAHLSKRSVKPGQFIAKGTVLGKVGMTGHASSPHLHFEVRKGQLPVNPMQFLQSSLYAKVSR